MMFTIVVFSFTMISFAPQYSTFGAQRYQDAQGEWKLCNYNAINGTRNATGLETGVIFNEYVDNALIQLKRPCQTTVLASLLNSVGVRVGILGTIFFFASWVFLISFAIGGVIALFKAPLSFAPDKLDDDYEELD